MSAQNTDKFVKVAPNTGWQIGASGISDGVVDEIDLVSASGLPTDTAVILTVDRVDSSGNKTPDKMERIKGIIVGDKLIDCIRGYEGTAQAHSVGAKVETVISSKLENDKVDGILVEHNQNGSHNVSKLANIPLNAPRGFLINGKIVVTDSAGITIAIKTLAGTDPSITNPVYCRIGDTVRSITSALSRSIADGTNWMNAGSAELATKEIDYFAYLVWDSNSSAVALSFARIPFANLVSDFSGTPTNEKYFDGYSDFTGTDEVENIGRFAATLSTGAGYTWSVPTFTASNLIQRPIFETRKLTWVTQYSGFSANPSHTTTYKIVGNLCFINFNALSAGTSNANTFTVTLPFGATEICPNLVFATDSANAVFALAYTNTGSNILTLAKNDNPSTWTASGSKYHKGQLNYLI
jgi:hypothetical protein